MVNKKTSEAQLKAAEAWKEKNKDKARAIRYKSYGKNFILNSATLDDLEEYKEYIKERENILKNSLHIGWYPI